MLASDIYASIAMATSMRASRSESAATNCPERVALVLDDVYGRWFAMKIDALLLNDPFVVLEAGDSKEDLMNRLRQSMLLHCQFYESQKTCDGVRNARFQERFGSSKLLQQHYSARAPTRSVCYGPMLPGTG
ncbi:unnamed protein product [Effrenium voratum]|uniref:Uncharacterized protein n=1 Tax=Effrenium voratum TaxID=2562239 RepID=A0AA36N975_9DINO|nr:unnamed protein product [Effrenium voratum]CAJ1446229.1 unnamed protein product [Effrenium voratum]